MAKSADLSEFEAQNKTAGAKCRFSVQLQELDEEQRARLDAAMEAGHIQHSAILRVLNGWGIQTSVHTVQRHRRNECRSCFDG